MPTGQRVDPYRNFNFVVEIDGIVQAGFQDCSGFGANTDPIEYREGNENPAPIPKPCALPGMTKYNNITLKWGLTDSRELYDWYRDISKGRVMRKTAASSCSISKARKKCAEFPQRLADEMGRTGFTSEGNDVAVETLEIAHEGWSWRRAEGRRAEGVERRA
jgi:phage tail-like protein